MPEAVNHTEHGVVNIRLEFGLELADKPTVLGELLEHNLFRIRERNGRIDSIRDVKAKFVDYRPNWVIADMSLNTTVISGSVEQDYTALKQELATKISEALKSREDGK